MRLALASSLALLCGCRLADGGFYTYPEAVAGAEPRKSTVTQAAWTEATAAFAALRREAPARPYTQRVRVSLSDPRTRRKIEGRGAVAVSPGKAARLVLLGPGGTTAIDLWVTRDQWRASIPAARIERRGGRDVGPNGMPIGFMRWWFLAPFTGELLSSESNGGRTFWYRHDDAVVQLEADGKQIHALRRTPGRTESVTWLRPSPAPVAGTEARYVDFSSRIQVDVVIEAMMPDEPEADAFVDPDELKP